jgi:pyruvate ferredoxin oxidoreductase gamma subunit
LNENGKLIISSRLKFNDKRILSLDALTIAEEELGAPITNTSMLGALLGVLGDITEEQILKAVEDYMPGKIVEKNKKVSFVRWPKLGKRGCSMKPSIKTFV